MDTVSSGDGNGVSIFTATGVGADGVCGDRDWVWGFGGSGGALGAVRGDAAGRSVIACAVNGWSGVDMESELHPRQSYEQSCRKLQEAGWLKPGVIPTLPERCPRYNDKAPLGVRFFRTRVTGDFSGMSIPRTFFGRSEIIAASFKNCDLSESNLCWSDFITVDFSGCDLHASDLRAAIFNGVSFAGCDLRDCDLRRSTFEDCNFQGADLRGAKLTRGHAAKLNLTPRQKESVAWQADSGEQPGGG